MDEPQKELNIRLGQYWVVSRPCAEKPATDEWATLILPDTTALAWFSTREKAERFINAKLTGQGWQPTRLTPQGFLDWIRFNFNQKSAQYIVADFDPASERTILLGVFRFMMELENYLEERRTTR